MAYKNITLTILILFQGFINTAKAEFWDREDYFANKEIYDEASAIIDVLYNENFTDSQKDAILATMNQKLVPSFKILKDANEEALAKHLSETGELTDEQIAIAMKDRQTIEAFKYTMENDFLAGTDRFYTNGIILEVSFNNEKFEKFFKKLGYDHSDLFVTCRQEIYNPSDRNIEEKMENEPGWAGVASCGGAINSYKMDKDRARIKILDRINAQIGILGEGAFGKQVQNGFHRLIGDKEVHWDYQVDDKFLVEVEIERNIKIAEGNILGSNRPDYNVIVSVAGKAGTIVNNAGAGFLVNFRLLGSLIDMYTANKFGPSDLERLAMMSPEARVKELVCKKDWNINLYLGADSKIVLNNNRIDDTDFNVSSQAVYYDIKGGVVVNYKKVFFELGIVSRSSEWKVDGNSDGPRHTWGHLGLTVPFKNFESLASAAISPIKWLTSKEYRKEQAEKRAFTKKIRKEGVKFKIKDEEGKVKTTHVTCD